MPTAVDDFSKRLADQLGRTRNGNREASLRHAPVAGTNEPVDAVPPRQDDFSRRLAAAAQGRSDGRLVAPKSEAAPAPAASACAPVGGGERIVKQGDCIYSIAKNSGHLWQTIWEDAANTELRKARNDPSVLLPDDRVHIPAIREKWAPGQTEMRHRFCRHGEAAVLPLRLMVGDQPLANQPYRLEIDGARPVESFTDAEGKLRCPIPANARKARLIVGEERREIDLDLGHLDPVESVAGVQKRLLNLGFDCGRTDGQWDRRCEAELRRFQQQHGLTTSGQPDDATRQKLRAAHGS